MRLSPFTAILVSGLFIFTWIGMSIFKPSKSITIMGGPSKGTNHFGTNEVPLGILGAPNWYAPSNWEAINASNQAEFTNSYTNFVTLTNADDMFHDWQSRNTNFLTIYLSNRVVIYPPGYRSFIMIQFTDEEWRLITNYYTDRETNISEWRFSGPTNRIPR